MRVLSFFISIWSSEKVVPIYSLPSDVILQAHKIVNMKKKLFAPVFQFITAIRSRNISRLSTTSPEFWFNDRHFIWSREICSVEWYFRRKDKEQIEALREKLKLLTNRSKDKEKYSDWTERFKRTEYLAIFKKFSYLDFRCYHYCLSLRHINFLFSCIVHEIIKS